MQHARQGNPQAYYIMKGSLEIVRTLVCFCARAPHIRTVCLCAYELQKRIMQNYPYLPLEGYLVLHRVLLTRIHYWKLQMLAFRVDEKLILLHAMLCII